MSHDAPVPPPYRPMPASPPPLGPPPSGPPPSGPPPGLVRRTPWWRRKLVLGTAGAVVVVAAAGGAYAAHWYFHTGAQPAEALPADTLAYAAIDLDPSGQQKIAAHSLVGKFPASDSEHVGSVGDARSWLADKILEHSPCSDLDYDQDIEPWLGDRAAIAALDLPDLGVKPVIVIQSTNDDKADAGMKTLSECGGSDFGGWKVKDGWIVFAPQQEVADAVVKERGDHSLADDDAFKKTVDAAGGTGIVTAYVSKDAADQFALMASEDSDVPSDLVEKAVEAFPSIALSVHAEGDAVRTEIASSLPDDAARPSDVGPLLDSLPSDSSAALVLGSSDKEADAFKEFMRFGAHVDGSSDDEVDQLYSSYEQMFGRPLENVLGDALSGGIAAVLGPTSADDFGKSAESLPLTVKIRPHDTDQARTDLDKLDSAVDEEDISSYVESSDDALVFGFLADARRHVLEGSGLADADLFRSVVGAHGQPLSMVGFVDLRSGLVRAALEDGLEGEDSRILENLGRLRAAGLSAWVTHGFLHAELKISVD